jgi:hypothetical protein
MGYRSDVTCIIYPVDRDTADVNIVEENYSLLKTMMNTAFKNVNDMFSENIVWHDREKVLVFKMNDTKWYDSFPDVQAFNSMLDFFKSEDNMRFCFEFVRVGEELEDNEEVYSDGAEYILGITREITINI